MPLPPIVACPAQPWLSSFLSKFLKDIRQKKHPRGVQLLLSHKNYSLRNLSLSSCHLCFSRGLSRDGVNADFFTASIFSLEGDDAINQCKQGVIATATHIDTWVKLGTALTDQDVTSFDDLTPEAFNA
jgi:hypothetical protein